MEAMRQISSILGGGVEEKGVRIGDEVLLEAFQERKKTFKLTRTKYQIQLNGQFSINTVDSIISLSGKEVFGGEFSLSLVTMNYLKKASDEDSRYLLKSLGDVPFRINGVYAFEAYVERGDVIDFGYNRIRFLKSKFNLNQEFDIPMNIVESEISILLEGETGTGKSTLAKKIHSESGRAGEFVQINLSSFSPNLVESEIFGHVKGAFTGSVNAKKGALLEANRGTLFLDEIDSITLDLQTKLLLFLDNHEVRPVGGERGQKVDVRVIFASGSNLMKKVEEGKMRKDFYYRIKSSYFYTLKSLRSFPDRIDTICQEFERDQAVNLCPELIEFYRACPWPGNIRQLKGHLMKKKLFSNGKKIVLEGIDYELLDTHSFLITGSDSIGEIRTLEEVKKIYCQDVFIKMGKNVTQTARVLDLSCNTLKAYLKSDDKVQITHETII